MPEGIWALRFTYPDYPDIIILYDKTTKGNKMKISNFRGHKYRRYTVALRILALAWIPYAAHTFFILPGVASFLAATFLVAAGTIPLWVMSRHTEYIAKEEFASLRARKKPTTLLGVVGPKN
jgi:hypothetical protein